METAAEWKQVAYFLSFIGPDYSRSSTLLNFKSNKIEKKYFHVSSRLGKLTVDLLRLRKELNNNSVIVIMSPAHKVTPLAKLICGKKVILDAGWPLTDGVISRGFRKSQLLKLLKSYILDFASFHTADLVLVESASQSDRIRLMYLLRKNKIEVSYTGLNETAFTPNRQVSIKVQNLKSHLKSNPTAINVLFRGKINNESGIDTILLSARELTKEANFIFLTGRDDKLKNLSPNCFQMSDVSESEMAEIYDLADIALGQISSHPRLKYTIPHKAFEAGYFAIPYISADNSGIREFLDSEDAVFISQPFAEGIVEAISLLSNFAARKDFSRKIHEKYEQKASQFVINRDFEDVIGTLISLRKNTGD